MELFTKNKDASWDRIVHLFINENDNLQTYINNKDLCKFVLILDGTGIAEMKDETIVISSPMIFCLTPDIEFKLIENRNINASVVYFKPEVINDSFTHDNLSSGYFRNMTGSTIYQDFVLLKNFYYVDEETTPILKSTPSAMVAIHNLVIKLNKELSEQIDTFWPCRSRSYFIELLFLINSSLNKKEITTNNEIFNTDNTLIPQIICYLNEHISEKIVLDDISRKFLINRNKLNELFRNTTGLTCINYLLKMRMNLSLLLLTDTDLPISEIGERVGFLDTTYFIKTFRKFYNLTPAQYRSKRS
ncbi:MAG: helix-turn-helix transcriptional regulator [Clostridiales bacterium]|nr:helix-turn-helix transcriptional regulator [Clostridiales bacterium]